MQNKGLSKVSHHTLIVAPASVFPTMEVGGAKQNNVGVKHTQRHPKSCFFSPLCVCFFFCFVFHVYACACVHLHVCTFSQGSRCCSCAEPLKEGRADFRQWRNPGDNVKYVISLSFVAALLCSLSLLFEPS